MTAAGAVRKVIARVWQNIAVGVKTTAADVIQVDPFWMVEAGHNTADSAVWVVRNARRRQWLGRVEEIVGNPCQALERLP